MLVEDDPNIRGDLAELLRDEGYEVVTASDGLEALSRMRYAGRPDVILLDLMMRGMNGWEFRNEQLQDPMLASVPVIILSGLTEAPHHAANLDAAACVAKPIEFAHLLETVQRHCAA
jgi:CheY-like chemotaxis protein